MKSLRGYPRVANAWAVLGWWRATALGLVCLATGVSHAWWKQAEALSLHAVPAMALGLAILIVLDGVVAVVRGGSKPWRVTWAWL
ncbi:MAG: hypothetical protein IT580_18180, partial [Verrucomicrobiales bacterium]|nr:hypothetical protein [Verrucomicrobiales bacterium]